MSSEAAPFFPDVLSRSPEHLERESSHSVVPRTVEASESAAPIVPTDEQLLFEIGAGSQDALATLYRRTAPIVHRVAARILRDEIEAEDLVHDLFLSLCDKASQFDSAKGSARSWLIHATYNRAFDRKKFLRLRQQQDTPDLVEIPDQRSTELASLNSIMVEQMLLQFREHLNANQQRVLELHFFHGYSFREIAQETELTLENTRKLYFRAMQRMRTLVPHQKDTTK